MLLLFWRQVTPVPAPGGVALPTGGTVAYAAASGAVAAFDGAGAEVAFPEAALAGLAFDVTGAAVLFAVSAGGLVVFLPSAVARPVQELTGGRVLVGV